MGYNVARIPTVYHALTHRRSQFGVGDIGNLDVIRVGNDGATTRLACEEIPNLDFKKPRYWRRASMPGVPPRSRAAKRR